MNSSSIRFASCLQTSRQGGAFRPIGISIVVAGALLLYIALQYLRGGGHPLSTTVGFDLCNRLGPRPAPELPDFIATPQAQIPGAGADRFPACYWPVAADRGEPSPRDIGLVLMTHQAMRVQGMHSGTAKFVETWLAESRADSAEVVAAVGPWKAGATIRPLGGKVLELLVEDDGIVLRFYSHGVERDALITFAAAAARRLRAKS